MTKAKSIRIVHTSLRGLLLLTLTIVICGLMVWTGWTDPLDDHSRSSRRPPSEAVAIAGGIGLLGTIWVIQGLVKVKGCLVRGTEDELRIYRPGRRDPSQILRSDLDEVSIEINKSSFTARSKTRTRPATSVQMIHISFARGSYKKQHGNPGVSSGAFMVNRDAKERFEHWQTQVLKP